MRRRALVMRLAAAGAGTGLLAGCGFQLRRPLPMPFRRIAFTGFAPRSPLAAELRRALGSPVEVVAEPARAEVVLQALIDLREKSVVASTAAGQVREVQLRVKLRFRAHTPAGRELLTSAELLLVRDMSYSETAALAKEFEEAQLYREMDADIALQVLRRLSTVSL